MDTKANDYANLRRMADALARTLTVVAGDGEQSRRNVAACVLAYFGYAWDQAVVDWTPGRHRAGTAPYANLERMADALARALPDVLGEDRQVQRNVAASVLANFGYAWDQAAVDWLSRGAPVTEGVR